MEDNVALFTKKTRLYDDVAPDKVRGRLDVVLKPCNQQYQQHLIVMTPQRLTADTR